MQPGVLNCVRVLELGQRTSTGYYSILAPTCAWSARRNFGTRINAAGSSGKGPGPSSSHSTPPLKRPQNFTSEPEGIFKDLEKTALNPFIDAKDASNGTAAQGRRDDQQRQESWQQMMGERWARALYSYYNWRTGSTNDLQLLILLNLTIIIIGSTLRHFIIHRNLPNGSEPTFGQDIYRVLLLLSFANGMPSADDTALERGFSLSIAGSGLIAFALTVALVQQSVRGAIEANVKTGGTLFEIDHIVVLTWGESQRDIEMVVQILEQLCAAYRAVKGRTVAVLSCRPKLEMEELFDATIPRSQRHGTRFVFRQGSPLVPENLKRVAASWASSIIVVSDCSRCPDEADAQALRAAVLLDEMKRPPGRKVQVIVEAKTRNVLRLIQSACSRRVIAVPTTQVAARRLARMVQHPAVADVSKALWSFASPSQVFLDSFPQLVGTQFGDLVCRFSDGLVLGLLNRRSGACDIAPPAETLVGPHDQLIMMRPTGLAANSYQPQSPLQGDVGENWDPSKYKRRKDVPTGIQVSRSSISEEEEPVMNVTANGEQPENGSGPLSWIGKQLRREGAENGKSSGGAGSNGNGKPADAAVGIQKGDGVYYINSPEFTGGLGKREAVLICGWQDTPFMLELLTDLDRGVDKLPRGSEVILLNMHNTEEISKHVKRLGRWNGLAVRHIKGNPLHIEDLKKVDLGSVKCALVVCDTEWRGCSSSEESGEEHLAAADYLRLDSMILVAQLNIRTALEEQNRPDINIVCEKIAFQGLTRFENREALPLGVSTNFTAYSAKLLTQVAVEPKALVVYSRLHAGCELIVQDSSCMCAEGEELSFLTLQLRAQSVGQVLLGYREIPKKEAAILSVLNPAGEAGRLDKRAWNVGDGRLKLITYKPKGDEKATQQESDNVTERNALASLADV
ncbi:g12963 [Coccomyxa viridis]|uniref:G12963 protein n=1 Tax=Coccomyxa viridis TaxID=1274662 RepID=A0ABP1GIR4_9CHLO